MRHARWTAVLLAGALSSCAALGGPRRLKGAGDTADARGEVQFRRVDRSVTAIDLRVTKLPDPEQLVPPGYVYVAWVRAGREAPAKNIGFLNNGPRSSFELRALTEHDCSELFVTAEAAGDAERPTGPRLLWTSRN